MSLISPGFLLAGVLLAGIPLLIHFLNRRRYREQRWAAMEFLLRAMKKNRKRLRFEQWLLLAVRCLLLGLLGLALARPGGCEQSAISGLARQSGLHVIVIDDSYSMAYEASREGALTHLDQAKRIASAMLDRMGGAGAGGEAVAIVTASKPAKVVFPSGYDIDAAKAAISRIEQTALATDLGNAVRLADTIGSEAAGQTLRTLDILSDGTRSSVLIGSAGDGDAPLREAMKASGTAFTKVTYHNLGLTNQQHAAVLDVGPTSALVTARQTQELQASIKGFGLGTSDAPRTLQWKVDDQMLPGGGDIRVTDNMDPITLSQVRLGDKSAHGPRVISAAVLGPDRLPIDIVRRRVVDVADKVKVLIVEGERSSGPLGSSGAFLRLALAPPTVGEGGVIRSNSPLEPEAISDLELPSRVLADYRTVILAGVGQIPEGTAEQLKAFVESGGVLITFMGEGVSSQSYNATMLPRKLIPGALVKRITAPSDSRGFGFDFKPTGNLHPMLSVFRGETRSGLDTAQVFDYWQTETRPDVERVLEFTNERHPAITISALGQGRVVFIATSAGADGWTSLPAKPVFVTLVHEMIRTSLTARDGWMNVLAGSKLELPSGLKLQGAPVLTDSAGRTLEITSETTDHGSVWRSEPLSKPGVYTLTGVVDAAGAGKLPIVVNPDAASEADIRTLDDAALTKAFGGAEPNLEIVRDSLPFAPGARTAASNEGGADYGWIVMLCVLGFVGLESLLAMRFGHHAATR